jgi:hypothetical protein
VNGIAGGAKIDAIDASLNPNRRPGDKRGHPEATADRAATLVPPSVFPVEGTHMPRPPTSSQEHHQTYRRRISNNEPTDRDHKKGHRTHRTLPFLTPHPSPEPKQHPLHGQVGAKFQLLEETLLRLSKIRHTLALRKERSVEGSQK